MSGVAKKMQAFAEKSSWIRKMFEEGARMKAEFGADKVFDFSIGNPDVPASWPKISSPARTAICPTLAIRSFVRLWPSGLGGNSRSICNPAMCL